MANQAQDESIKVHATNGATGPTVMSTVTVTVQDYVFGIMSQAEEQALGLALHDAHFVEEVDITWWRPVDKMERHIKLVGDQEIIQPVVTMFVELSKAYESPISVVRSLS